MLYFKNSTTLPQCHHYFNKILTNNIHPKTHILHPFLAIYSIYTNIKKNHTSHSTNTNTGVIKVWWQGFQTALEDKHIVLFWSGQERFAQSFIADKTPIQLKGQRGEVRKRGKNRVAKQMTNTGTALQENRTSFGKEEERGVSGDRKIEVTLEEDKHTTSQLARLPAEPHMGEKMFQEQR